MPENVKRVRIAVAINEHGFWGCAGWEGKHGKQTDDDLKSVALDGLDEIGRDHVVFLEADIPLPPVAPTVEGTVQP